MLPSLTIYTDKAFSFQAWISTFKIKLETFLFDKAHS